MATTLTATLVQVAGYGLIAGSRSMTAPALFSRAAARHPQRLAGTPFGVLTSPRAQQVLTVAAVGELIGDKLPFTPSRLDPLPLGGRIAVGAFIGAAVCRSADQPVIGGALVGGATAVLGAWLGYTWRTLAAQHLHLPSLVSGLIEDAIVVVAGRQVAGL